MKLLSRKNISTLFFTTTIMICFWGKYDSLGNEYLQSALTKSLATFATARTFNGVVSVAQQTEVNLTPMGFGVVLSPAQILDPLNDLVEQFSSVMLLSSAILVGETLILELTGSRSFSNFTVFVSLLSLLLIWLPKQYVQSRNVIIKFSFLIIFIRFLIPTYALLSGVIHNRCFENYLNIANMQMKGASEQINEVSNQELPKPNEMNQNQNWQNWIEKKIENSVATIKNPIELIQTKVEAYKKIAEDSVKHIINLIALFILETVIFPILFFWTILAAIRNLGVFFGDDAKINL